MLDEVRALGPNVGRLMIYMLSREAIPPGGGLGDGVEFFTNVDKHKKNLTDALAKTRAAILVVRDAGVPNLFVDADDETIASEVLRRIEERQRKPSF